MRPMRILLLALAVVVATLMGPELGGAASIPSPACNGGGCGGWFRSNVTVTWSYDPAGVASAPGCGGTTITEDTSATTVTCTLNYTAGGGTFNSVTVAPKGSGI